MHFWYEKASMLPYAVEGRRLLLFCILPVPTNPRHEDLQSITLKRQILNYMSTTYTIKNVHQIRNLLIKYLSLKSNPSF